jgi:hypothetical protein
MPGVGFDRAATVIGMKSKNNIIKVMALRAKFRIGIKTFIDNNILQLISLLLFRN